MPIAAGTKVKVRDHRDRDVVGMQGYAYPVPEDRVPATSQGAGQQYLIVSEPLSDPGEAGILVSNLGGILCSEGELETVR